MLLSYINRNDPDITDNLETFIFLAERKIFRRYRNQNNEKLITYDMRADPNPATGSTQIALSNQVDLPDDYLEVLTLQHTTWKPTEGNPVDDPLKPAGGDPLQRVSLTELQMRQARESGRTGTLRGSPQIFARQRNALYLHPSPDADGVEAALITMIYYCDLTGLFDTPTSDNNVLQTCPDLFIYGSLLEMEPFLKPESEQMNMIPIWKNMYEEAFAQVEVQNDRELYSGSANEVKSAFSGGGSNQTAFSRDGYA